MENRIPTKTLLKIFHLIQSTGVEEEKVFGISKSFDPEVGEKIIQAYIQKGKVEDLDLSRFNIQRIPEGLKCKILNLDGNKTLEHLPQIQAEKIWAENTNIERIGEGLKCKYLSLIGNKTLKKLPKIEVDEIWANDTNIQTIEEGLKCKYLNLAENKVLKHLPKIEAEKIIIKYTNIQKIPQGLKCKVLVLYENKMLKEFPRNLKVETLSLKNTYFSETYTEAEVREMIEAKGGRVGEIWI